MNINPYPSTVLQGINDKSARTVPLTNAPLSQHTPLFAVLSQMGRGGVKVIASNEFTEIFGTKTLDSYSNYYTHQSEAVQTSIEAGNSTIAVNRIIPKGARTATVAFGVDNSEGISDEWFMADINTATATNSFKPILTATMDNEGEWGNEYGFFLKPADDLSRRIAGIKEECKVYNFQLIHIDEESAKATILPNLYGEYSTLVTLRPNTAGRGDVEFFINDRIRDCFYRSDDELEGTPLLRSVNFDINQLAQLGSLRPNWDATKPAWDQDIDKLFGTSLVMANLFSGEHHFQFSAGSDGLESDLKSYITSRLERVKIYDDGVREFFNSLTDNNMFTDIAKYPYSTVWDTGFSFDTKLSFRTLMDTRRDVNVVLSCFTVADNYELPDGTKVFNYIPPQNEAQIQGMASRLQAAYRLFPESFKFGTAACRAMIVKNSGVKKISTYKKRRSVVVDLIYKVSKYLGSGDGKWRERYAIDNEASRILEGWTDLDSTYQPPNVKAMNEQNGLTYVETLDTSRYFFPHYQTIYDDPTSVLNDFVTVMACCWLEKVGASAWRKYGGDMSVGNIKRREKIAKYIQEETRNAFHNRFEIKTRIAEAEAGAGYSDDIIAEIYADKTKTANSYTIEAHRMTDLYP